VRWIALALVALSAVVACSAPTPPAVSPAPLTTRARPIPSAEPVGPPLTAWADDEIVVSLNQQRLTPGPAVSLWTDGPVEIRVTFPLKMDRPSTEAAVAAALRDPALRWEDDRTIVASFRDDGLGGFSLDVGGARSADGSKIAPSVTYGVSIPAPRHVWIFGAGDLAAPTIAPSRSFAVRAGYGLAVAPGRDRVLVFEARGPMTGPAPRIVHVDTGDARELGIPVNAGPFSYGDWLPSGEIVLVGREVWVANGDGSGARAVLRNDWTGLAPWLAVPSPSGRQIVMWSPDDEGLLAIADLGQGTVRRLTGPFLRCAQDGAISVAWSVDERFLATASCDGPSGEAVVRIVEVARDRTVRTISRDPASCPAGLRCPTPPYSVAAFGDGFIVVGPSGDFGATPSPNLGIVYGWDGAERERLVGGSWLASADRRYVLELGVSLVSVASGRLIDLATGQARELTLPSFPHAWTAAGLVIVQ
jgi:hypothetical protein